MRKSIVKFSARYTLQKSDNFFKNFCLSLFILRERVGKGQGAKEKERIPSRLCTVSTGHAAGLELMNPEIMT